MLDIDQFMKKVDLSAELTGTGLVFVGISEEGNIALRLYDASEVSVIANDASGKQEADAISIITVAERMEGSQKQPQLQRYLKSQVWTNDSITVHVNGARESSQSNELGFMPFVPFKGEEVYNQYLGHSPATQIRKMNHIINTQLTHLGYMIKMQSSTPVVLTGYQNGEGIVIHPGKAISLPAGASADTLQFNPKVNEVLEEITFLEERIYQTSNIPKVSVIGDENSQSGKELQIKWAPLMQTFRDKALRYERYELNLANMILRVLGMEPIENINVHYPEELILPLGSDVDELNKEIKIGLSTPIEGMLKKQPHLSETEAEAEVRSNIEFNSAMFESGEEKDSGNPNKNQMTGGQNGSE
jgi:hypothetical protein